MIISYVFTFKFILTRLNHTFLKTFDVVLIFWKQVPGNFGHLMAQCNPSCQVSSSLIVTVLLLFFWKLINRLNVSTFLLQILWILESRFLIKKCVIFVFRYWLSEKKASALTSKLVSIYDRLLQFKTAILYQFSMYAFSIFSSSTLKYLKCYIMWAMCDLRICKKMVICLN